MEQVLEHYGILDKFKPGADSLNGPCPIHKGSNPTQFRVSLSKNIWNCFSECKHGGNVLDFITEMEDVSIHAAAFKAIEWFNLDPEAMAARPIDEDPEKPATPQAPKQRHTETSAPHQPVRESARPMCRSNSGWTSWSAAPVSQRARTDAGNHRGFRHRILRQRHDGRPHRHPDPQRQRRGRGVCGTVPGEPAEDTPKYKLPRIPEIAGVVQH